MRKQKQKLPFKPTPISRLLKRSKMPLRYVGYPTASDWNRYYQLNYEFVLKEKREWEEHLRLRAIAKIEYGEGPFVDDYAAIHRAA
jgi:hypothetical protein